MRFDPAEWSTVYDAANPSGHEFVFRHGAELARAACLGMAEPGEHWIDVGAGTGHLAAEMAAAGLRVTAVDYDPDMVRAARARFGSADRSNGLGFALANADKLPFADGAVDGVVATALIGLLPDPRSFLLEVSRVLRPAGDAVITFSNRSSVLHGIGMKIRARGHGRRSQRYAAPARRYSRREVMLEFERAALKVVRTYYFNFFLALGRRMWPPRRIALSLEPRLQRGGGALVARNLLVVAARMPASARDWSGNGPGSRAS